MFDSAWVRWTAFDGGVIGYGAKATSIGEGGWSSGSLSPEETRTSTWEALCGSAAFDSEVTDPASDDATPPVESTGEGFDTVARLSFNFLR